MSYVLVDENGQLLAADYSFSKLRQDNPDISFPREMSDERLAEFGVVALASTDKPDVGDSIELDSVEDTPKLVDGVWTQAWKYVTVDAGVLAAREAKASNEAASDEVKGGAFYLAVKNMTPVQVINHVNMQITDLETAKAIIGQLAALMVVLMKRGSA